MNTSGEHVQKIQICRRRDSLQRRGLYFRQHEIHALFDELIHRPWGAVPWHPPVDVREDKNAFIVEIDLPGVRAEEVRVVTEGRTLMIEGRRQLGKCEEVAAHICERPDGRFVRTFEFDSDIEDREIESHWQDGVLTVTIPKDQ